LQYVLFKRGNGPFEAFSLFKLRGTGPDDRIHFLVGSNPTVNLRNAAVSTTVIKAGQFYHLVGTYDGHDIKLYVNGVLERTQPNTFDIGYVNGKPLVIGGSGEPFNGRVRGVVDEVQIYNRALSATEARLVYETGTTGLCGVEVNHPPVVNAGPDRTITQGPATLSGSGSLYSSTFAWSLVSGPDGTVPPANVSLTNTASAQATFNATANGTYVVQLVTGDGTTPSAPVQLRLVVNNALSPAPAAVRFSDIKTIMQTTGCTGCHTPGGPPPVLFANIDRNGDGVIDATDDLWFYADVRGRINFTDLVASPLLRKPSGNHHGGGLRPGFDTSATPGQAARANYDLFLNWILNGAPQ